MKHKTNKPRKRKPKEIELAYHYVGDDSPEMKAEAEKRVEEVFDILFTETLKHMREKKAKEAATPQE